MTTLPINQILLGDVRTLLPQLADNSVDCVVTSVPYWALRDYNVAGQIGLEETPELYVQTIVDVFEQVRRVLKPTGTCWLNIGDTYWGGKGKNGQESREQSALRLQSGKSINRPQYGLSNDGRTLIRPQDRNHPTLKPKDLCLIPFRLAIALQDAGWYIRQDIIWNKTNPMPESVTDRCTKSHEYIFLLTKSRKYYFDSYVIGTEYQAKTLTTFSDKPGTSTGNGDDALRVKSQRYNNTVIQRKPKIWPDENGTERPPRANKRSIWSCGSKAIPDRNAGPGHFATFPEELIIDCIKAGCPAGGVVLDPFMGSGTTAVVARSHGRNFIGCELNPDYITMANRRLDQALGMFAR